MNCHIYERARRIAGSRWSTGRPHGPARRPCSTPGPPAQLYMLAPIKRRINSNLEPTWYLLFFAALDLRPSSIDVFLYNIT